VLGRVLARSNPPEPRREPLAADPPDRFQDPLERAPDDERWNPPLPPLRAALDRPE
jgi:hypothetical protein